MLHIEVATLDELLDAHRAVLGGDFAAYRNHAYRVLNLVLALSANAAEHLEKLAIATAFHDLGIWTDGTFDYLQPSARLAQEHLEGIGRTAWTAEITEMILEHHKVFTYRGDSGGLVEFFRRADWIDVSRGLITFGVPREVLRNLYTAWPAVGFHRLLVRLTIRRLRTHPWSPLPMIRL